MRRGSRRNQTGVVIVEAAFVIPILFTFILTMVDLGDWAYQAGQAAAAARDGARVGIIHYQDADSSASNVSNGDLFLINKAITRRLAGQTYSLVSPSAHPNTATCVQPTTTTELTNGCHPALPGCDRIMVKVQWQRSPWSPIGKLFGTATVKGEAEMTIGGAALDTTTTLGTPDTTGCV